jgi:hypothetical protein
MKPEDEAPVPETGDDATKALKKSPFAFGSSVFGATFGITNHDTDADQQPKEGEH